MTIFFIIFLVALLVWWALNRNPGSQGGAGSATESDAARQQRFQQDSLAAQKRYVASQTAQQFNGKTTSEEHSDRYLNEPTMPSDNAGSDADAEVEKKERIRRYIAAQKRYVENENLRRKNEPETSPAFLEFRPAVKANPSVAEPSAQLTDSISWDDDYPIDYVAGSKRKNLNGVALLIYFVDRNGEATERNISTVNYVHDPETHGGSVYAFCHLRGAYRTFRFSQIKMVVDLNTGEVVDDIGSFLDSIYMTTPVGVVDKFLDDHSAGMFVLFSFAKADGAMRAKERVIMLDWARAQGLSDDAALTNLETQMKKDWYATTSAFWDAVKTVKREARGEAYVQSLWSAVRAIINSDKKLSEQEEQYLKYAAKQWGLPLPELIATVQPQPKT